MRSVGKWLICFFIIYNSVSFGQEDTIRGIQFDNLKKTNSKFVQKVIRSSVGNEIDTTKIETEVERLSRFPSFATVDYKIVNDTLVYNFTETFTLIPGLNVWSQNDFISFGLGIEEFNFLGRGMHLGAYYQYNGKHSYSMFFRYPYLIKRFGLASTFSSYTSDEPIFINNNRLLYEYSNNSFEVLGSYEINLKNIVELAGVAFRERYTHLTPELDSDAPTFLDIRKYLVKTNYHFNNTKFFYYYVSGWKVSNSYELVVTSNDLPFHSFKTFGSYYKRVKEKGNFGFRAGFGLATNTDSPFPPFVLDNHENVRGVGDRIARGTGFGVLNVEYRHTLITKNWFALQGVGFVDASTWRNPGNDFSDFGKRENMKSTAGIGFRAVVTKIHGAVLRVDYGVSITQKRSHGIVVGVGQYF